MATQKTNLSGRKPPQDETQDTGEVGESVNIGGRDMERVDMRNTLHKAMQDIHANPNANAMRPGPTPPSTASKEEVDRALPDFLRDQETQQVSPPTAAGSEQVKGLTPEQSEFAHQLAQKIVEAKTDGREEAAKELEDLLGQLMGQLEPKRIRAKKETHPALQKLRRNLGLQRINPATVEWCGTKWHLYPPPPALDYWVAQMVEQNLGTYAALKLAAGIVGLDDAPLYDVFGVELRAEYQPPDGSKSVSVKLYEKRCDGCSEIIEVDAKECDACGSLHDPFEMPLNLRVRCAELMNRHFSEDFGPYEDLHRLLDLVREEMPDRVVSKEQLYPFLELSPTSSSETDTTPSGEKPSSD